MDFLIKLEILEALKNLKARYFYHLDHKNWSAWREVFAEDVVLDISNHFPDDPDPTKHMIHGPDAIVASVSKSLETTATAHHGHNPIFDIKNESEATGIWAMQDNLFMADGTRLDGFGHYHETYRRIAGTWRITRTKLSRVKLVFTKI